MIGRCGQPEVSWWGWRNADDENLVQSIAKACGMDHAAVKHLSNGSFVHSSSGECSSCLLITSLTRIGKIEFLSYVLDPDITNGNDEVEPNTPPPQKLLILDARSYAAAVANRAKGGGCECPGTHAYLFVFCTFTILYQRLYEMVHWLTHKLDEVLHIASIC